MPRGLQLITFPDAAGATNDILLAPLLEVDQVNDLFSSSIPQSAGSSIIVEEVFTIGITIDRPELIDVDKRWFGNRYYLGTYRVSESALGAPYELEDEGFITSRFFRLRRERSYLLRPQNSNAQTLAGEISLNWCNLQLVDTFIQTSPTNPPVAGIVPYSTANALVGRYGRLDSKLGTGILKQRFGALMLWLNDGASLSSASYTIGIAPQIEAVELEFVQSGTCIIGTNCDSEFQAFLDSEQGFATPSAAIAAYLFFLDPTGAIPDDGSITASEATFACTDGETRIYWTVSEIIS